MKRPFSTEARASHVIYDISQVSTVEQEYVKHQ